MGDDFDRDIVRLKSVFGNPYFDAFLREAIPLRAFVRLPRDQSKPWPLLGELFDSQFPLFDGCFFRGFSAPVVESSLV